MIFRNRDLKDVFEDRYQANHNKELEENARNNKKSLMDRMLGNKNNNNISGQSNINNGNNPIGYNPNNRIGR